ncbi:L-asparaginase-like isoform X1 [Haliotis rufescens]|uniref:L-asparaginase-like isoform X1 n=1 Tax=Haliotis rufescens TaxID=6454 RepID=UPI00201ECBF8|nr:L-asparaginase-like isoform X1 [Haliotis rufescens]
MADNADQSETELTRSKSVDEKVAELELKTRAVHDAEPLTKILVLYTGGTIGMVTKNGVYEPEPDCMVQKLRALPIFHDAEYGDAHFCPETKANHLALPLLKSKLKTDGQPSPNGLTKEDFRVLFTVEEFEPLLDSSNMNMQDWATIANRIQDNYDQFDGFVVLHGTDTMAYTASALSFMCEHLGKPIILTGSQIPIYEVRSDGRDNFLSSLIIAGNYCIPEVLVCFNEKVFRGNRTIKNDSTSFSAFKSPNMAPIVTLEIDISVDWAGVFRSGTTEKFRVATNFCPNVGLLRIFPGITAQTVRAFMQPPMQGVVLQTYGAGNAPDNRQDLLQLFREATNWGIIIINITQCTHGRVSTSYATGKALRETGVIPGGDMTPEAALAKLGYILGKDSWSLDKKRKMMSRNLRGEMTTSIQEEISIMDHELIESVARTLSLSSKDEIVKLRDALYPNLMCAAACTGDVQALEKLRQTGGNISAANQDGRTALHVACRGGHFSTVQYLLHHGASVHIKDYHGDTPLIDAISGKHMAIIKLLVQTGAVSPLKPEKMAVELCSAASQNDVDTIRAWHEAGADLNVCDYNYRAALHVAVCTYNTDVVQYLLDNGANTDIQDIFGNTPMSHAEKLCYHDILKMMGQESAVNHIE